MFRTLLRRPSISDLIKSDVTIDNDDRSYSSYTSDQQHGAGAEISLYKLDKSSFSAEPSLKSKKASLKRIYKLPDLIVLSICNVVGSGIYVLAGTAGKYTAGPGLLISLIIGLFSAGMSAFCYAEFASIYPIIGNTYSYMYISSGEQLAFTLGWLSIITNICAASINAIGASGYLRSFIETFSNDLNLDNSVFFGYHGILSTDMVSINISAALLVLTFLLFVLFDAKLNATTMNLVASFNILLLFLFIIACFMMFDIDYIINPCDYNQQFTDESCPSDADNSWLPYGFTGILQASSIAFWLFAGAEGVALMSEESINPTKDIPKSIYITLIFVFILYELVLLGLFGLVPFFSLNETAPLSDAFAIHNEILLQRICSFGAFSTLSILLYAYIIGCPRAIYRMSIDGLLPECFRSINRKTQTPTVSIFWFGFVTIIIALLFDLSDVLAFASTGTMLSYTFVAVATLIIRYSPSHLDKISNKNGNNFKITQFWTDMMVFTFIWSFFFLCLITSFVITYQQLFIDNELQLLWIIIVVIFGGIILCQIIVIHYFDKVIPWKDWIVPKDKDLSDLTLVPFSPYTQIILIMLNSYITASEGIILFLQWFAALLSGVIVYIIYGYKHSNLNTSRQTLL